MLGRRSLKQHQLSELDKRAISLIFDAFVVVWSIPLGLGLLWPAGFTIYDAAAALAVGFFFIRRIFQTLKSVFYP